MDQSALNHVKHARHKMDLMYRASTTNEDRTRILTHNNPLPKMLEKEIDPTSCVGQYLPSWQDDFSVS